MLREATLTRCVMEAMNRETDAILYLCMSLLESLTSKIKDGVGHSESSILNVGLGSWMTWLSRFSDDEDVCDLVAAVLKNLVHHNAFRHRIIENAVIVTSLYDMLKSDIMPAYKEALLKLFIEGMCVLKLFVVVFHSVSRYKCTKPALTRISQVGSLR